jgi:hypothetical protein
MCSLNPRCGIVLSLARGISCSEGGQAHLWHPRSQCGAHAVLGGAKPGRRGNRRERDASRDDSESTPDFEARVRSCPTRRPRDSNSADWLKRSSALRHVARASRAIYFSDFQRHSNVRDAFWLQGCFRGNVWCDSLHARPCKALRLHGVYRTCFAVVRLMSSGTSSLLRPISMRRFRVSGGSCLQQNLNLNFKGCDSHVHRGDSGNG